MTRKLIQRLTFLTGGSLLSVIVAAAGAKATTIDFNDTGSIVSFTVPATGVYEIDAFGGGRRSQQWHRRRPQRRPRRRSRRPVYPDRRRDAADPGRWPG